MTDYLSNFTAAMDRQWKAMNDEDAAAKKAGTWVGRLFSESIADGFAYYRVASVSGETVTLDHVDYCDGYKVPMIESMGRVVPLKYVSENIERRDRTSALFAR